MTLTAAPTTTGRHGPLVILDGSCPADRETIGGKAWSVNRMRALGLPVPPAFAVTTDECPRYLAAGRSLSDDLWARIVDGVRHLEEVTGRRLGDPERPLLVSVRSGAALSMPGMMDTVLNLGMTTAVEEGLARVDPAYAADTHRRFRDLYRAVVLGGGDEEVPVDPWAQLRAAIGAVFESWESPRARTYRAHHGITGLVGTAVTVQAMVFGNLDDRSGTGVLFSRNPLTGERPAWGEWLTRGQGEDVVSGRVSPDPLEVLAALLPEVHAELLAASATLERANGDLQDIEFTVESGRLWLLQSRSAKRSAAAAVRCAVDMADEGLITRAEAVRRLTAEEVRTVLRPALDGGVPDGPDGSVPVVQGMPACPGLVTGVVVTDPEEAEERAADGESVVLARVTTSPDDLHGMIAAAAIVTEHGGSTSHAAVVSREIDRPCVVGCGPDTVTTLAGHTVTVDGGTGRIWLGALDARAVAEDAVTDLARLAEWAQSLTALAVHRAAGWAGDDGQVVDLDAAGTAWRTALDPTKGARGEVLDTDEGIHAAVEAGLPFVIVGFRLPALLAAVGSRA